MMGDRESEMANDRLKARAPSQRFQAMVHDHERDVHLPALVGAFQPVERQLMLAEPDVYDGDLIGARAHALVEILEAAKDVTRLADASQPAEEISERRQGTPVLRVHLECAPIVRQCLFDVALYFEGSASTT